MKIGDLAKLAFLILLGAVACRADSVTYQFTGTGYFAGTDVSFTTTNGAAVMGTNYSPNSGSTDLFVTATTPGPTADEGAIQFIVWDPSRFAFDGCSSVCTVEMYLVTAADQVDGPTIAALSIPGPGTYTEFFDHGTLTVTETPKPSCLALLVVGFGLLMLTSAVRKRARVIGTHAG